MDDIIKSVQLNDRITLDMRYYGDSEYISCEFNIDLDESSLSFNINLVDRNMANQFKLERNKDMTNFSNGQCAVRSEKNTKIYGMCLEFGGDFSVEFTLDNHVADEVYDIISAFMDECNISREFDCHDFSGDIVGDLIDVLKK